jgi:hypothetical protein
VVDFRDEAGCSLDLTYVPVSAINSSSESFIV